VARGNPNYFITYGNGKSAARVTDGLRPNGAHRWYNYYSAPKEETCEDAAVLHFTYNRFDDLKSRRDRCECAPTEEDAKKCFILPFDRAAFLAASLKTDEELMAWYKERLVWSDPAVVNEMVKNGLFIRVYAPQVMIKGFRAQNERTGQTGKNDLDNKLPLRTPKAEGTQPVPTETPLATEQTQTQAVATQPVQTQPEATQPAQTQGQDVRQQLAAAQEAQGQVQAQGQDARQQLAAAQQAAQQAQQQQDTLRTQQVQQAMSANQQAQQALDDPTAAAQDATAAQQTQQQAISEQQAQQALLTAGQQAEQAQQRSV
jgi:hypothetical protein